MSNLTPAPGWDNVPQLEQYTLAIGGAGGIMNAQAQSLVNRTELLKQNVDTNTSSISELEIVTDLLVEQSNGVIKAYGLKTGVQTGAAANAGIWIPDDPIIYSGQLFEFRIWSLGTGTIEVGVYGRYDTAAFNRRTFVSVSVVPGYNFFSLDITVYPGEYLGIKTSASGLLTYITGGPNKFPIYSSATGVGQFAGPTDSYAFQYSFNVQSAQSMVQKKWNGLKYASFGDSITWYNGRPFNSGHVESGQIAKGYQSYIVDALGCVLDNNGLSGKTMPEIYAERISSYNFAGAYAVTITSGANDHRKAVAPGTIAAIGSAFNTSTFAGALQASIEKVIASNKDTKIFLITPIKGWYFESGTANVPGPYNGEQLLSVDYVNVMKHIGALYSIPVIDWYNNVGLNTLNNYYFLGDNPAIFTAYLLHPKNIEFKIMGEMLLATLKNY